MTKKPTNPLYAQRHRRRGSPTKRPPSKPKGLQALNQPVRVPVRRPENQITFAVLTAYCQGNKAKQLNYSGQLTGVNTQNPEIGWLTILPMAVRQGRMRIWVCSGGKVAIYWPAAQELSRLGKPVR